MTTTVKWYTDESRGAPVLSGTAGALIALLDACLVTGFGSQAVSSLVIASGEATMTVASTPNPVAGSVVVVAGVTGGASSVNGEQRVTAIAGNTIKFATALSDQVATGTITTKMAAAGWVKEFTGTNLAVYRSPDVTGTRQWLKVDDSGTVSARMRAYESMADIGTGAEKWMDNYWFKSSAASSTAVAWAIFADAKTFYLRMNAGNQDAIYPFGDFNPTRANEPFAAMGPNGYAVASIASASNAPHFVTANSYPISAINTPSLVIPRSGNFLAKAVTAFKRPELVADIHTAGVDVAISSGNAGPNSYYLLPYPNTSDNALVFTRFQILETSNRNLRGNLRGVYCSPQHLASTFTGAVSTIPGQGDFSGRTMGVAACVGGASVSGGSYLVTCNNAMYPTGRLIVDLTGPW